MSHYYEINKADLQALEAVHGLPDKMVTRDWNTVTTSLDGIDVIIESSEPLDETILGVPEITLEQARTLVQSAKYYNGEI